MIGPVGRNTLRCEDRLDGRHDYTFGRYMGRGRARLNFSLYSQHAESVVLLLFAEDDPARPLLEYRLDPRVNKTWNVWHCRFTGQADAAALLRLPNRRASPRRSREVARLRPGEGPAGPLCEGGILPARVRPRGRPATGPEPGRGASGRPARARAGVRLGRRPAAAPRAGHRGHLRDARPRVHDEPDQRGRARHDGGRSPASSTRSPT